VKVALIAIQSRGLEKTKKKKVSAFGEREQNTKSDNSSKFTSRNASARIGPKQKKGQNWKNKQDWFARPGKDFLS